jgi:hypothetical protein
MPGTLSLYSLSTYIADFFENLPAIVTDHSDRVIVERWVYIGIAIPTDHHLLAMADLIFVDWSRHLAIGLLSGGSSHVGYLPSMYRGLYPHVPL